MSVQVPPHAPHGEGDHSPKANGGGGNAHHLRKSMSLPEILLWQSLRRKSLGLKFRRQHPVPPYVIDFYCARYRLAVEVDGEVHDRGDRPMRDTFLKRRGYRVVHVPARDVLKNPEAVAETIALSVGIPLHHPADGPPPHASHGEDLKEPVE